MQVRLLFKQLKSESAPHMMKLENEIHGRYNNRLKSQSWTIVSYLWGSQPGKNL